MPGRRRHPPCEARHVDMAQLPKVAAVESDATWTTNEMAKESTSSQDGAQP